MQGNAISRLPRCVVRLSTKAISENRYLLIERGIEVIDIPGTDDGFLGTFVKAFLEDNAERLIPLIIFNLDKGGFMELAHT